MAMSDNAQKAFNELQAIGAPVMNWGASEGYPSDVAFVLIWANGDVTEIFADITGRYIREEWIDGRYINPLGYRQDVHEILKKYNLVSDWWNSGQVVIYNDPEAPGYKHSRD